MNPNSISDLRDVRSQGANVGDKRDFGGLLWRWNGAVWEMEGGQAASGTSGGGGGSTASSIPAFKFDWDAARLAAFDPNNPEASPLGRYYLQKLNNAKGDVETAKRYIQEDYDRGARINTEDYQSSVQEDTTSARLETRDTQGTLNNRGVLLGQMESGQTSSAAPTSNYAQEYHLDPLKEKQDLRRQAIERAMSRTGEELSIAKTRGFEDQNTQYKRTEQQLEEEAREKAYVQYAPTKYAEEYSKYKAANNIGG